MSVSWKILQTAQNLRWIWVKCSFWGCFRSFFASEDAFWVNLSLLGNFKQLLVFCIKKLKFFKSTYVVLTLEVNCIHSHDLSVTKYVSFVKILNICQNISHFPDHNLFLFVKPNCGQAAFANPLTRARNSVAWRQFCSELKFHHQNTPNSTRRHPQPPPPDKNLFRSSYFCLERTTKPCKIPEED